MTLIETLRISKKKMQMNKIIRMKTKIIFLSILRRNKFVLYSPKIKRTKENEKKKTIPCK